MHRRLKQMQLRLLIQSRHLSIPGPQPLFGGSRPGYYNGLAKGDKSTNMLQTPAELEMEDGDVIDVMENNTAARCVGNRKRVSGAGAH